MQKYQVYGLKCGMREQNLKKKLFNSDGKQTFMCCCFNFQNDLSQIQATIL